MLTRIHKLVQYSPGTLTKITGWVRTVRQHKRYSFIEIDDGSGHIQAVFPTSEIESIVTGSSVEVAGVLVNGPSVLEIQGNSIKILGTSDVVAFR